MGLGPLNKNEVPCTFLSDEAQVSEKMSGNICDNLLDEELHCAGFLFPFWTIRAQL